jgi:Undecaprenyl-phosphate galactose phosphotransferase WbaP
MSATSLLISSENPPQLVASLRYRAWLAALTILCSDICGLILSFGVSILALSVVHGQFITATTLEYLIALSLFVGFFKAAHLYRTTGVEPVDELRRAVLAINWTFLLLVLITFLWKGVSAPSRGLFVVAWACTVIVIPATRLLLKPILGKRSWFAKPVAIFGGGRTALELIETLRRNPGLALRPEVVFSDNRVEWGKVADLAGVPIVCGLDGSSAYSRSLGIDYAIIAMPELSRQHLLDVIKSTRGSFSKVLLLPDLLGVSSIWVETRDVGGRLGLEIRDNLLRRSSLAGKRLLDLALISAVVPLLLPLCALLALLVKLQSPGRVFYAQRRAGRDGKIIRVWKFRTMLQNADALLQQVLADNAGLRAEWSANHKLKHDPRVTSLGRFMRKTSLDELPQLWNVVKGEMSLVGPRPIPLDEIEKSGDSYHLYKRVSWNHWPLAGFRAE